MSGRSLRRSRRAPKKTEYKVGDVIELNRNGKLVKATLTQRLSQAGAANRRWLVESDVPPFQDEVYEHQFGKGTAEEGSPLPPSPKDTSPSSESKRPAKRKVGETSSGGEEGSEETKAKKKVAFSNPSSSQDEVSPQQQQPAQAASVGESEVVLTGGRSNRRTRNKVVTAAAVAEEANHVAVASAAPKKKKVSDQETDGSKALARVITAAAAAKKKKVSDREARSRRRQALMSEPSMSDGIVTNGSINGGKKRKISGAAAQAAQNKRKRAAGKDASEPVTKVKFLTGTLYIYKGKQRRVEFVRRV